MSDDRAEASTCAKQPARRRLDLRHLVGALLATWAVGLVVAGFQLQTWQQELGRVLLQLRADALLRASVVRDRETVAPQWYRERALALLPAVEELRNNTSWTLVIPGSWLIFDDLQVRAAQRIDAAFAQVVVQTVHRELQGRASALAGVVLPLNAKTAESAAGCATPQPPRDRSAAVRGLAIEELAEYAAMTTWLAQATQLDKAAAALQALATPGAGQAENLRTLVRYSLGAEVSGTASRSLALFQASLVNSAAVADRELAQQLRWAVHCSARRGMEALHARVLARNDLLSSEESLRRASVTTLFDQVAMTPTGTGQMTIAHAMLDEQHRLLSRPQPAWLRAPSGGASLGPAHEQLLEQLQSITLLGADAVAGIRAQATSAHAQFRARFAALFERPGSGVVWQAGAGFVHSAERAALRIGLAALLREPFMADDTALALIDGIQRVQGVQGARLATQQDATLEDVVALAEQRRLFARETLPRFPATLRPAVARFVDERLARLAHARALAFARGAAERAGSEGGGVLAANGQGWLTPTTDTPESRLAAVDAALTPIAPSMAARVRARLARDWQSTPPAVNPQHLMGASGAPG